MEGDGTSDVSSVDFSFTVMPTPRTSNILARDQKDEISVVTSADWGMIRDEESSVYSDEESFGNTVGVLIVSGDEDESGKVSSSLSLLDKTATGLSLPGTDYSLPTDIGSIDVTFTRGVSANNSLLPPESNENTSEASELETATINKTVVVKHIIVALSIVCVALTAAVIFLAWNRNSWRTFALDIQYEMTLIQGQLDGLDKAHAIDASWNDWQAKQVEDIWVETNEQLDWESEDVNSSSKVLLADNCWFKAEAHVKLGNCGSNAKDCLSDVSSSIYKAFEGFGISIWETAVNLKDANGNLVFNGNTLQSGVTLDALTEASTVIASVAVAATDAMRSAVSQASKVMDDSILYAVEQTKGAIEDASYTMLLSLKA